jgi:hypothetical protein
MEVGFHFPSNGCLATTAFDQTRHNNNNSNNNTNQIYNSGYESNNNNNNNNNNNSNNRKHTYGPPSPVTRIVLHLLYSIQFNSLLFMCRVNSYKANYRQHSANIRKYIISI